MAGGLGGPFMKTLISASQCIGCLVEAENPRDAVSAWSRPRTSCLHRVRSPISPVVSIRRRLSGDEGPSIVIHCCSCPGPVGPANLCRDFSEGAGSSRIHGMFPRLLGASRPGRPNNPQRPLRGLYRSKTPEFRRLSTTRSQMEATIRAVLVRRPCSSILHLNMTAVAASEYYVLQPSRVSLQ